MVQIPHQIFVSLAIFRNLTTTPSSTCVFNGGVKPALEHNLPMVGIEPPTSVDIVQRSRFRIYIIAKLPQLSQPTVWL